jgi:hypothetical protein
MQKYCFGKLGKKEDRKGRTLQMAKYSKALPAPPESFDGLTRMMSNVGISDISKLFPIDGNDQYGDCVMAGAAHILTCWNAMIRKTVIPASEDVIAQYNALTGGIDSGLNILDTLVYWRNNNFFGHKILAFVENDIKNHTQLKQSIWLFGAIKVGMRVQKNAIKDFEAGKTWTPGCMTRGGHDVILTSPYNKDTVTVLTWGGKIPATWGWAKKCLDESYTILPDEAEVEGFSPDFPWEVLKSDLVAVSK